MPWVLIASAVVLLLVLVPMGIWAASQRHTGQVAVPVAQVTDGCCQTNGNLSPLGRSFPFPRCGLDGEGPPLRQGGGAVGLHLVSSGEVALRGEVVVEGGVHR